MIQITIYKKPEGQYKGFQVLGHADSVSEGADLVCCAVSVLTVNLVNSLETFTDDRYEVLENEDLGLTQITFTDETVSDRSVLLMDSYVLGVQSIAEEYGSWLNVRIKEV